MRTTWTIQYEHTPANSGKLAYANAFTRQSFVLLHDFLAFWLFWLSSMLACCWWWVVQQCLAVAFCAYAAAIPSLHQPRHPRRPLKCPCCPKGTSYQLMLLSLLFVFSCCYYWYCCCCCNRFYYPTTSVAVSTASSLLVWQCGSPQLSHAAEYSYVGCCLPELLQCSSCCFLTHMCCCHFCNRNSCALSTTVGVCVCVCVWVWVCACTLCQSVIWLCAEAVCV